MNRPVLVAFGACLVAVIFNPGLQGAAAPGPFFKTTPANGAVSQAAKIWLRWSAAPGATRYLFCIDRINNDLCDSGWTEADSNASTASIVPLAPGATYYWQVLASSTSAPAQPPFTAADNGAWASFSVSNRGDFTGDGQADLVWQDPATGQVLLWEMDGLNFVSSTMLTSGDTRWQVVGSGDFTRDGKTDLLWQHPDTGALLLWEMDGPNFVRGSMLTTGGTLWRVAGVGDFDTDGNPDIVWQDPDSGAVLLWQMDGSSLRTGTIVGEAGTYYQVLSTGRIWCCDNLDGLLWQHPSTGDLVVWTNSDVWKPKPWYPLYGQLGFFYRNVPAPWQVVANSDYTGDGRPDIVIQDATTGEVRVWDTYPYASQFIITISAGTNWRIRAPR